MKYLWSPCCRHRFEFNFKKLRAPIQLQFSILIELETDVNFEERKKNQINILKREKKPDRTSPKINDYALDKKPCGGGADYAVEKNNETANAFDHEESGADDHKEADADDHEQPKTRQEPGGDRKKNCECGDKC